MRKITMTQAKVDDDCAARTGTDKKKHEESIIRSEKNNKEKCSSIKRS